MKVINVSGEGLRSLPKKIIIINGLVSKLILLYVIFLHLSWFMRRQEGEERSAETEWAGSKIKIIHRNTREIKTTKEEKKAVIKEEIENHDYYTLLLQFSTAK